jgi:hypothetical protein
MNIGAAEHAGRVASDLTGVFGSDQTQAREITSKSGIEDSAP